MFCKKCGNEIAMEEKFCPVCGTGVETVNEPVTMKENAYENRTEQNYVGEERKKPNAAVLIAAIIGGIVGALAIISGLMNICM